MFYNVINQCGIQCQTLRTLLEDTLRICKLHLVRASAISICCLLRQPWNRRNAMPTIKIFRSEVGQMKILVRVCTRLGSDVISISIMGGTLSRGVCLSKLLLNITSPSRRNKKKQQCKSAQETLQSNSDTNCVHFIL